MTAKVLCGLAMCGALFGQDCLDVGAKLAPVVKALDGRDLTAAELAMLGVPVADRSCAASVLVEARLLISQRRYPQVDALSETATARYPGDANILALRGQILLMKGQAQAGREFLERALRADPKNAEAHFQLGVMHDHAKQWADAAEHFQKSTDANPSDPRAWDYLGLNLEPLGDVERAEAAFRKGIAVNQGPRFDYFLDFNYGRLLLKMNRLEESKTHLDRAIGLVQQSRAIRYERAKLNFRLRQYAAAAEDAGKALELADPAGAVIDLQIYALLEQIHTRLGNPDLAQKYAALARSTPVPPKSR